MIFLTFKPRDKPKALCHNDYKQRENIAQVHRFVKDLYINDKQAQAKITLFEKIEGKNKIYTLELESLSPTPQSSPHTQAGVAVEAQVTRDVVRPNANIAKTDEQSIAHKLQTLKTKQDKLSRQIDEYKHKHNIPEFTGFGKLAMQIDDPHYQSLQAEYRDLTKQTQALQLQLARQVTPQSPPK